MSTVADLPGTWAYLYSPNPTLSADGTQWTASLSFVTSQANVVPFVTVIAGEEEEIETTGGTITRVVMMQHPIYDWLWSSSFTCKMFGTASDSSTDLDELHSHVQVDVEFRSTSYPTSGDEPYMTWQTQGAGIYTTIPGRKMAFSSGEPLGQDAGVWIGQTQYVLTMYQCPDLNDSDIEPFVGKVNSAIFRGIPIGHLRFDTWSSSWEVSTGGVIKYTKQLVFSRQTHHWNEFYRSDGILDEALDPDGNPAYDEADFNLLLGF